MSPLKTLEVTPTQHKLLVQHRLFPEDGELEEVQCSTMGVFAPLTGIIGAMQAMEAIKLVAGVGESLNGRLQTFDAKSVEWRSMRIAKDPACAVCGAK